MLTYTTAHPTERPHTFQGQLNLQKSELDAKPAQVCVGLVTEVTGSDPKARDAHNVLVTAMSDVGIHTSVWSHDTLRSSSWGGGAVQQPGLQGRPLVRVPVCSNHWLLHWCLQSQSKIEQYKDCRTYRRGCIAQCQAPKEPASMKILRQDPN